MADLLLTIYATSALIVLATALYCIRRDGSASRTAVEDVFSPALIPGLNTVVALGCIYVLWEDSRGVGERDG